MKQKGILIKAIQITLVCLMLGSMLLGSRQVVHAANKPVVETRPATSVSQTAAFLNGRIANDGGSSIIERRFSWGVTPSCSDDWTASVGVSGNYFSYYLTGLNPGTTYYFQAWAKNSAGFWGNGSALPFTTSSLSTIQVRIDTYSPSSRVDVRVGNSTPQAV